MLSLREYRNKADRLADFLPWAALVAPGVVLNKDGSFQRTARFRGSFLGFPQSMWSDGEMTASRETIFLNSQKPMFDPLFPLENMERVEGTVFLEEDPRHDR